MLYSIFASAGNQSQDLPHRPKTSSSMLPAFSSISSRHYSAFVQAGPILPDSATNSNWPLFSQTRVAPAIPTTTFSLWLSFTDGFLPPVIGGLSLLKLKQRSFITPTHMHNDYTKRNGFHSTRNRSARKRRIPRASDKRLILFVRQNPTRF